MKELSKIPSEFIEPYLQRFLMIQIEGVAMGIHTPEDVRESLKGVDYFIQCFGDIHSKLATQNRYYDLINLSDEKMVEICKATFSAPASATLASNT